MTVLCIALMLIGTILICIEMFVPGFGICGASGIFLVVASAIITVITEPLGVFIVIGEVAFLGLAIAFILNYLKRTQMRNKIILNETLALDIDDIGDMSYFLGKEGVTKTPLRPFGEAEFNSTALEVVSISGYIPENKRIKVTAVENRRIMVKRVLDDLSAAKGGGNGNVV